MIPVIRVILSNDTSHVLPPASTIAFFQRCVVNQQQVQLTQLLNLIRLFLKEYRSRCVDHKEALCSMVELLDNQQSLVHVLKTMVSKLSSVCLHFTDLSTLPKSLAHPFPLQWSEQGNTNNKHIHRYNRKTEIQIQPCHLLSNFLLPIPLRSP